MEGAYNGRSLLWEKVILNKYLFLCLGVIRCANFRKYFQVYFLEFRGRQQRSCKDVTHYNNLVLRKFLVFVGCFMQVLFVRKSRFLFEFSVVFFRVEWVGRLKQGGVAGCHTPQ